MGDKPDDGIGGSNKWSVIDEAMKSMMEWTESAPSTKPTPRHRKSEPNPAKIKESLSHLNENKVPQSAPIDPGFKIAWPETSSPLIKKKSNPKLGSPGYNKSGHKNSKDSLEEDDFHTTPIKSPIDNHKNAVLPRTYGTGNNHHGTFEKSHSFASSNDNIKAPIHHQSSSPALIPSPMHVMPNISEDRAANFSPVLSPYTSVTGSYVDVTLSNNQYRRQSAPSGNQRINPAKTAKGPKRSESYPHHAVPIQDAKTVDANISAFKNLKLNPRFTDSIPNGVGNIPHQDERVNSLENNSYNDNEYTKALLQHQRDRKFRLQKELDKNKILLGSLQHRVKQKEQQLMERRQTKGNSSSSLRVTLEDITKIRNANRQLEIDCNCMHKELELIKRNSCMSGQNFYENIQGRNPSQQNKPGQRRPSRPAIPIRDLPPPPPPPEEDNKWRCKHCTFDNHFALNKCEMCEHARMKS